MAKPARGLPADFVLDLPDEKPVVIGDFLDEEPPAPIVRKQQKTQPERTPAPFRPEIVRENDEVEDEPPARPVARSAKQPSVIRYQLNLTPKSKTMLEELVKHIRTYSPQNDARTSEVFQGIVQLLHNAMGELELAELPPRGAWGSVTLRRTFLGRSTKPLKRAIVRAARKRGAN